MIERLEALRPRFAGATALVFAPGPSLPDLWNGRSSPHPKICINDAYRDWRSKGSVGVIVPDADIVYGSDVKWWHARKGLPGFGGVKATIVMGAGQEHLISPFRDIVRLAISPMRPDKNKPQTGYDPRLGLICHGANSGYGAVHLAAQLGAKLIAMVGFDWKGTHYFGTYPPSFSANVPPFSYADNFRVLLRELAAYGVEVVNCTPGSALVQVPPASLDAVLSRKAA